MQKLIASLLTVTAILPLVWFSVVPNGAEICASSVAFATPQDTQSQRTAATYAKAKFCHVVASFPQ